MVGVHPGPLLPSQSPIPGCGEGPPRPPAPLPQPEPHSRVLSAPPPLPTALSAGKELESRSLEPRINVEADFYFPKAKYLSPDGSSAQTRGEQTAGAAAPQRCLQDPLQAASPGPFCRGSLSISRDKGCKNARNASPAPTAAEGKPISKGASGLIHTKRERGGRLDLATRNPSSQNPTL